jgi:co-chaperonin GroES (HSP10)
MSNKGKLFAQNDWVIVEKFEPDNTTSSGIIVNSAEDPDLGRVLSVGYDCILCVKEGDIIAPDWSKAVLIRHLTCAIRSTDVIAIVQSS